MSVELRLLPARHRCRSAIDRGGHIHEVLGDISAHPEFACFMLSGSLLLVIETGQAKEIGMSGKASRLDSPKLGHCNQPIRPWSP